MGLIGGMMAAGLAQGAGEVVSTAQGQIDVNNKEQLAQYQAQLTQDSTAAQMRLQQTIGNENTINAATGPVGAATRAGAALNTTSAAQTAVDPTVQAAKTFDANVKYDKLAPGQQLVDDSGALKAENKRITLGESRLYNAQTTGDVKANQFSAKEINSGQEALLNDVRKQYVDPTTQKVPSSVGNVASFAYTQSLAQGKNVAQAKQDGSDAADRVWEAAQGLLKTPAGKGMDTDTAMRAVIQQAKAAHAAAGPQPGAPAAVQPVPAAAPPGAGASAGPPPGKLASAGAPSYIGPGPSAPTTKAEDDQIVGLDSSTVRRIAGDPKDPRNAAALRALAQQKSDLHSLMRDRMSNVDSMDYSGQ